MASLTQPWLVVVHCLKGGKKKEKKKEKN